MWVRVEFFAQARDAAGRSGESVPLAENATLLDLARTLATKHGPRLGQLLLGPDGGLSRHVLFTVADSHVSRGATLALADGDRVTIVPPISGG